MFLRQNDRSFHIGVMTVKVSFISLRAFPGKSAKSEENWGQDQLYGCTAGDMIDILTH
jgi:hypothetical protein